MSLGATLPDSNRTVRPTASPCSRYLNGSVKHLGRKRVLDRERLLHADIGVHQVIVLLHASAIDPAKRLGRGEFVLDLRQRQGVKFMVKAAQIDVIQSVSETLYSHLREGILSGTLSRRGWFYDRKNSRAGLALAASRCGKQ